MPLDANCSYLEVLIVDTKDYKGCILFNLQVVISLSLQRRVEGLLQEHLDRIGLVSEKPQDELANERVVDHVSEENQEPLLDESMMEKVLQRKSSRMRNLQRAWEASISNWVAF